MNASRWKRLVVFGSSLVLALAPVALQQASAAVQSEAHVSTAAAAPGVDGDWQRGYRDGFRDGYADARNSCSESYGAHGNTSYGRGYSAGYAAGFAQGEARYC
jgi:flagellar biosynthesis/type III secretory pathway protein FliH